MNSQRDLKFLLDENLSYRIARGFTEFGEKVEHVNDVFGSGIEDVKLLPRVGKGGWIFITNDYRIHKKPQEAQAVKEAGLSVFFIDITACLDRWGWIKFFVDNWKKWKTLARETERPFAFRVKMRGEPEEL